MRTYDITEADQLIEDMEATLDGADAGFGPGSLGHLANELARLDKEHPTVLLREHQWDTLHGLQQRARRHGYSTLYGDNTDTALTTWNHRRIAGKKPNR